MTTVVVVDEAEEQLREIDEWWREHRPAAATLVIDEFQRCITLLESSPDIGTPFHRCTVSASAIAPELVPRIRYGR